MNQPFEDLKQKLQNADKQQAREMLQQIKSARQNGDINEQEERELLSTAEAKIGDISLGGADQ